MNTTEGSIIIGIFWWIVPSCGSSPLLQGIHLLRSTFCSLSKNLSIASYCTIPPWRQWLLISTDSSVSDSMSHLPSVCLWPKVHPICRWSYCNHVSQCFCLFFWWLVRNWMYRLWRRSMFTAVAIVNENIAFYARFLRLLSVLMLWSSDRSF